MRLLSNSRVKDRDVFLQSVLNVVIQLSRRERQWAGNGRAYYIGLNWTPTQTGVD